MSYLAAVRVGVGPGSCDDHKGLRAWVFFSLEHTPQINGHAYLEILVTNDVSVNESGNVVAADSDGGPFVVNSLSEVGTTLTAGGGTG